MYCYCSAAYPPGPRKESNVDLKFKQRGGITGNVSVYPGDMLLIKAYNPGQSRSGIRQPSGKDLIPPGIRYRLLQVIDQQDHLVDDGYFNAGVIGDQRLYYTPTSRIDNPQARKIEPGIYKLSVQCTIPDSDCDIFVNLYAREVQYAPVQPSYFY